MVKLFSLSSLQKGSFQLSNFLLLSYLATTEEVCGVSEQLLGGIPHPVLRIMITNPSPLNVVISSHVEKCLSIFLKCFYLGSKYGFSHSFFICASFVNTPHPSASPSHFPNSSMLKPSQPHSTHLCFLFPAFFHLPSLKTYLPSVSSS